MIMTDMKQAIMPKSDQLNSDDLITGPVTVTITDVAIRAGEQPVSISYEGDKGKPWKPCKSMCRVLVNVWGADAKKYIGQSLTLYRDPKVTFGGMEVGGIRISHMTGISESVTVSLTATRKIRKPFTVQPLRIEAAESVDEEALMIEATDAARKGSEAFRAYWKTLTPKKRDALKPYMETLKGTADGADNPFPGDAPSPTALPLTVMEA
jgi:hypothetical protein